MSVSELIAQARAKHLDLMVDTCAIVRLGEPTLNTTTGALEYTPTQIYSGACRLKAPGAGSITVTERPAGEAEQAIQRQTLVLPHGSVPDVAVGDLVTMTNRTPVTYTVVGFVDGTSMSARSLLVEAGTTAVWGD